MAKKHATIEQVDGCGDERIESKYENTSHYWKKGYLGRGYQSYIDVIDIIEDSDLSEEAKAGEKQRALDSRKEALGENFNPITGSI